METIYDHLWHKIGDLVDELRQMHPNFNQMKHIDKAICALIDAQRAIGKHQDILEAME